MNKFDLINENKDTSKANNETRKEEYILQTKDICKSFKKERALSNINIKVRENTVYGLLGPNGAGKSTLLKIICGMLKKSSGDVYICGHKWSRKDLSEIGSLIESPPIYENLSAVENLKVRTTILGLDDSRIKEVLDTVDLKDTGRKKAGHFSMGMKQRLGIAIALISKPKLLILDEPTNGLDPIGISELRNLICSFKKKNITVIVSSHILSEISLMADYIGIIANGKLGYEGKIDSSENLEELFMNVVKENHGGYKEEQGA